MMMIERLGPRPKIFLVTLSGLLLVAQAVLNYRLGPDYSFDFFYLAPISLVAWFVGRRAGISASLFSALAYFITDLSGTHFAALPHIPYFNLVARLGAFLFAAYFVSALRRSLDQEHELAHTDELTGAVNRRAFLEAAAQEINRARRHRHQFTVAYMDVDDFKKVNDRYGHSAGDQLLRSVAATIRETIREIDVVGRLGGDEFVVLLPETDAEAARFVVSRVHERIQAVADARRWSVTFSLGVVTWTTPPRTVDVMIKQADDAMYAVKHAGKNHVAHFTLSGEPLATA